MKNIYALAAVAVFAIASTAPAAAAPLLFVYTNNATKFGAGGTFTLDSNPTPDNVSEGKGFFAINNVAGVFQNGLTSYVSANIDFFLKGGAAQSGGFELDVPGGNSFLNAAGQQLFNFAGGTLAAPTFRTGQFVLDGGTTLTISEIAAVPEPATWAMMIGGFGLVGGTLRRRSKVASTRVTYA